jgi:DHA1 family tetracycline resistance protein-like MFS transporter
MEFAWKRANPVGRSAAQLRRQLLGLAAVDFWSASPISAASVFVLYAAFRSWNGTAGLTLPWSASGGARKAFVQAARARPARGAHRSRHAARRPGAVIYARPSGLWFLLGVPVMALRGVVGPTILAMSGRVSPSEQGQLQGAISASRSLAGLIGPAIFTTTFAWLLHGLPGAPFLLAALLLVAAAVGGWMVTAPQPADDPPR